MDKNDAAAETARNDLKYARRRIDELSAENVKLSSQVVIWNHIKLISLYVIWRIIK